MFNFSGSELMFLLILGLVILGPEKLPTVLRKMGRFYGEFKRMTNDAQSDFRQAFAEPLRIYKVLLRSTSRFSRMPQVR